MAAIDYGALLRVNGKLVNKDADLFMESNNTGYILDKAFDPKYNSEIQIKGNYFVYAGDEHLLLCFYKTWFYIISNGIVIGSYSNYTEALDKEEIYIDDYPIIKVERLTKQKKVDVSMKPDDDFKDILIDRYGYKKGMLKWYRMWKNYGRMRKTRWYWCKPSRFIANWEYNGNKYEVIFGYGIDPNKEVWDNIKYESYGFNEEEIAIIDSWFNGESARILPSSIGGR